MRRAHGLRRFELIRVTDVTGISGTGKVASGVVLPTGRVVLEWRPPITSLTLHASLDDVITIHCHAGATELYWIDGRDNCPICEGYGTDVAHNCPCECLGDAGAVFNGQVYRAGRWQRKARSAEAPDA